MWIIHTFRIQVAFPSEAVSSFFGLCSGFKMTTLLGFPFLCGWVKKVDSVKKPSRSGR